MIAAKRLKTFIQLIRTLMEPWVPIAFFAVCIFSSPLMAQSNAQPNDKIMAIDIPAQPDAIVLGTGPLPARLWPSPGTASMAASLRVTSQSRRSHRSSRIRRTRPVPR